MALVISPRNHIEQIASISIETDLPIEEIFALESRVDAGLDVSSLAVNIGGVGVYPTMVMRSTDLNWVLSTVAHEWIHNYLTLRPLGMLYGETPELRSMNETTASIAGNEIGGLVIKRFYPELISASHPSRAQGTWFLLRLTILNPEIFCAPDLTFAPRCTKHASQLMPCLQMEK